MKKKTYLAVVSLLCVCALTAGLLMMTAGAATPTISEEEISGIVSTATDTSQVTSPFTAAVSQVRNSVVGINNYRTQSSSSYGYGFGYGDIFGDRYRQGGERLSATGSVDEATWAALFDESITLTWLEGRYAAEVHLVPPFTSKLTVQVPLILTNLPFSSRSLSSDPSVFTQRTV